MPQALNYRNVLPVGCPPADAEELAEARIMYYLVTAYPPTDSDFVPLAMRRDVSDYSAAEACCAHGLSVFKTQRQCELGPGRLLSFRDHVVCGLLLDPGAGKIKRTGKSRGHHTLWPYTDFDIIACCEPVE